MRKDIADKWIAELRSGKHLQGTGQLRQRYDYNSTPLDCCLGVLAFTVLGFAPNRENCARGGLTDEMKAAAGMHTKDGRFEVGYDMDSLARMNDRGFTFAEIANLIEREWAQL